MEAADSKALFINFNQDHSLVAIGTAKVALAGVALAETRGRGT